MLGLIRNRSFVQLSLVETRLLRPVLVTKIGPELHHVLTVAAAVPIHPTECSKIE